MPGESTVTVELEGGGTVVIVAQPIGETLAHLEVRDVTVRFGGLRPDDAHDVPGRYGKRDGIERGRVITLPGLSSHPAVEEVAVVGVPGQRWDEAVYAVVSSRRLVTPGELIAHCRQRIAGFKVPRRIESRTGPLPKPAAGKILKRELREPHWAGQQTHVFGG